jgi:hypothetical protein
MEVDPTLQGRAQQLVLWIKQEGEAGRVVVPDPSFVSLEGLDLARGPVTVEVVPGRLLKGEVYVHAVAAGAPGGQGGWTYGEPLAFAGFVLDTRAGGELRVAMLPFDSACDGDGDYFQDCTVGGCCQGVTELGAFGDCLDALPPDVGLGGNRDAAQAHPFQDPRLEDEPGFCGNGLDEDCDGLDRICNDADGDGVYAEQDCDDGNARRYPGATEVCGNGIDEDCDQEDLACREDRDGDGVWTPEDCNDNNPNVSPNVADEFACDGQDDDCDGLVDEGLPCDDIDGDGLQDDQDCAGGALGPGGLAGRYDRGRGQGVAEVCGNGVDEDCDGQDLACDVRDQDKDGHRDARQGGDDCDDARPQVYPGAAERCGDGIDNDCQGGDVPCEGDGDGDGFTAAHDCDDADPNTHPDRDDGPTGEVCDGKDNDCDGLIDEGNPLRLSQLAPDAPARCGVNDVGECVMGWNACSRGANGAATITCADAVFPAPQDACDFRDEDCDGQVDENVRNGCDGCEPLDVEPGTACGTCRLNRYVCGGPNETQCDGDRVVNGCGGCTALAHDPGDTCGPCGRDRYVCDGTERIVCNGNTTLNECGGCRDLDHEVGELCGNCGQGRWACEGREGLRCGGASQGQNECGGCGNLREDPGTSCGQCDEGTYVCDGNDGVRCDDPDEGVNACGGCGRLSNAPGSSCGTCGQGRFVCDGANSVRCDNPNAGVNACGGCTTLNQRPGASCGTCEAGEVVCNGINAVTCRQGNLSNTPGTACGACGQGRYECDPGAPGGVSCANPDAGTNECGGCTPLMDDLGDACGTCDQGSYACSGLNALVCDQPTLPNPPGAPCGTCNRGAYACDPNAPSGVSCQNANAGANACGGCDPLNHELGAPCGPCGLGAWACDGPNATRCNNRDAGVNECGGCDMLQGDPGDDCGTCGQWACQGQNAVACQEDMPNACGGCAPLTGSQGDACGNGSGCTLQCANGALACRTANNQACP